MYLKPLGSRNVLQEALAPIISQIHIAFIYGSIAKQEDTAHSDIDLMLISDNLTYADLFKLLEEAQAHLGRSIHPTFYSLSEWKRKREANNHFLSQVTTQPKIFLIGTEDELSNLDNLVRTGNLKVEPMNQEEFAGLLRFRRSAITRCS